jgi:hypothetical protein
MEVQLNVFLTLTVDESEWLASRPGSFTTEKRIPVAIA